MKQARGMGGALLALLLAAGIARAAGEDIKKVQAEIRRQYAALSACRGEIDQEETSPVTLRTSKFHGKFLFSRPNLVRVEYDSPAGSVLVLDGEKSIYYDAEARQATLSPLPEIAGEINPFQYLDFAGIEEGYAVKTSWEKAGKGYRYRILPEGNAPYDHIDLFFNPFLVLPLYRVEVAGQGPDATRIVFSGVERIAPPPKKTFSFTPPAGVETIDMRPKPKPKTGAAPSPPGPKTGK